MENARFKRPQFVTIYLMNVIGSDIYKIGYTTYPIGMRRAGIKCEVGPVKIIGTSYCDFKHEAILHNNFKNQKASDGIYGMHKEYFRLSDSDVCFVMNYFKNSAVPNPVMNNRHPQWKEFLRYISFWVDRAGRTCNHTHSYTKESLRKHKHINMEKSIELFIKHGGYCDCAVLKIASNFNFN